MIVKQCLGPCSLWQGRVGQEYNQRKNRKGAFWEDRYHATAVDTNEHFIRCLTYIDLNMVRTGVVDHPREWRHGGWHEIVDPPRRYRIIARDRLKQLLYADENMLTDSYERWVEDSLQEGTKREKVCSEAVAAGSVEFVEGIYPVKFLPHEILPMAVQLCWISLGDVVTA